MYHFHPLLPMFSPAWLLVDVSPSLRGPSMLFVRRQAAAARARGGLQQSQRDQPRLQSRLEYGSRKWRAALRRFGLGPFLLPVLQHRIPPRRCLDV